jgi:hypothetical protein
MTTNTSIFVYGSLGYELEYDNHIKTRLIFAVADDKRKRLAWYFFSQTMMLDKWNRPFELAEATGKKPQWNKAFGEYNGSHLGDPNVSTSQQITTYALALSSGTLGNRVEVFISEVETQTNGKAIQCGLSLPGLTNKHERLEFRLKNALQRRSTVTDKKDGFLWLLQVEPFSIAALTRGIRGPQDVAANEDPYLPAW